MKTPRVCSNCKGEGHTKRTCTVNVDAIVREAATRLKENNEVQETYELELRTGGKTFRSVAGTLEEAIALLGHPDKISTKGELYVFSGNLRHKVLFTPLSMKRFFYPMSRAFMAKNLLNGLKST